MGVDVDGAGDQPLPGGVDRSVGAGVEVTADEGDPLSVDQDVRIGRCVGIHDGPALDQGAHRASFTGSREPAS
jgi:hypothetical protein